MYAPLQINPETHEKEFETGRRIHCVGRCVFWPWLSTKHMSTHALLLHLTQKSLGRCSPQIATWTWWTLLAADLFYSLQQNRVETESRPKRFATIEKQSKPLKQLHLQWINVILQIICLKKPKKPIEIICLSVPAQQHSILASHSHQAYSSGQCSYITLCNTRLMGGGQGKHQRCKML